MKMKVKKGKPCATYVNPQKRSSPKKGQRQKEMGETISQKSMF